MHEAGIPVWQRDGDAGGHQDALPRLNDDVHGRARSAPASPGWANTGIGNRSSSMWMAITRSTAGRVFGSSEQG